MRISLLQISLLWFFKTFRKYLPYAFLGLFISLLRYYVKIFVAVLYLGTLTPGICLDLDCFQYCNFQEFLITFIGKCDQLFFASLYIRQKRST